MEKQRNRGQDGAGMANVKLDTPAGKRYISRKRSTTTNWICRAIISWCEKKAF